MESYNEAFEENNKAITMIEIETTKLVKTKKELTTTKDETEKEFDSIKENSPEVIAQKNAKEAEQKARENGTLNKTANIE